MVLVFVNLKRADTMPVSKDSTLPGIADVIDHVDIVIARYAENIDWVLPAVMKVRDQVGSAAIYLYHKGGQDDAALQVFATASKALGIPLHFERLENLGRESHTYVYHILTHVLQEDNVSGTRATVFLQGTVADHMHTWYRFPANEAAFILSLIHEANMDGGSVSFANTWEREMGACSGHYNFRILEWKGDLQPKSEIPFGDWYVNNINSWPDKSKCLRWWPGALFCVRNSHIKRRTKDYYENLLKQHMYINPEVGHFMERAWLGIMSFDPFF